MTADQIIATLELEPHPEGGFFRETYRATETLSRAVLPSRFRGERAFSTAIYFLIQGKQFSALHRICSDELWHFYLGEPLEFVEITSDGRLTMTLLGHGITTVTRPQAVIPAGSWFGSRLARPDPHAFALVGCTVAPGFDFADFELASREKLLEAYPQHEDMIRAMTRG
ncbi:MAG: cupin domain-containing protein [Deltaproteobacteria bacterium]|nr:MAG: cupin domain-containing protein [Deltaproteobacteria bacterium]